MKMSFIYVVLVFDVASMTFRERLLYAILAQKKGDLKVYAMDQHTIFRSIPQVKVYVLHDGNSTKIMKFLFLLTLH